MIDVRSLVTLSENVINGTIGEELYENVTIEYVDEPNVTLTEAIHMPTIAILECQLESAEFTEAYNDCIVECTVKALTEGAMPEYESLTEAAAEGFKEKMIKAWTAIKNAFTRAWGKVVQVFNNIKNALSGVKKALANWEYAEGMEIPNVSGHVYYLDKFKGVNKESISDMVNIEGVKADVDDMTAEITGYAAERKGDGELDKVYLARLTGSQNVADDAIRGLFVSDVMEFKYAAQADLKKGTFNKAVVIEALDMGADFDKVIDGYKNLIHQLDKEIVKARTMVGATAAANAIKNKVEDKVNTVKGNQAAKKAEPDAAGIDAVSEAATPESTKRDADLAAMKNYFDAVTACQKAASKIQALMTTLNKQRAAEVTSMAKAMLGASGKKAEKPAEDAEAKTEDAEGGETITVMDFGM